MCWALSSEAWVLLSALRPPRVVVLLLSQPCRLPYLRTTSGLEVWAPVLVDIEDKAGLSVSLAGFSALSQHSPQQWSQKPFLVPSMAAVL